MKTIHLSSALAVLALSAAPPGLAAAGLDRCTGVINSLPATITTAGVWCLDRGLATNITSGAAITVAVNNATIACSGFVMNGISAGVATQASGIYASNRNNLVVRDCNLRGFHIGVNTIGGLGVVVQDSLLQGNRHVGVRVRSPGSTVRGNTIIGTGGSPSAVGRASGISVSDGVDVIDNNVSGVGASQPDRRVVGIHSLANDGATISGNRVSGIALPSEAIRDTSARVLIHGNQLSGPFTGNATAEGIRCFSTGAMASGNSLLGFTTAIIGCYGSGAESAALGNVVQ